MITPLAPQRYKVQFTASQKQHDKLARLRALTKTQVPDGDLAAVVELAVDAYLAKVDATRFGKTDRPRTSAETTDTTPHTRHIPAAVRRAVVARDGNRCTFVGVDGHRCSATDDLQFDHVMAYAKAAITRCRTWQCDAARTTRIGRRGNSARAAAAAPVRRCPPGPAWLGPRPG